jgi:hypothetical protein
MEKGRHAQRIASALASLALAAAAAAQQPPAKEAPVDLTGSWVLDRKASDDVETKVKEAAGPDQVKGGGPRAIRVLPKGNEKSEVERMELRDLLLGLIGSLEAMDLRQSARDLTLARGEDVGIFYFDREHVRVGRGDRKLRCHTTWKGTQLIVDQVFSLLPDRKRLILALRLEHARLQAPLELKLVYDREEPAPKG